MTNKTIVLKFGGASLATNERIEAIADIIQQKKQESTRIAIVVSAMGTTTDELIARALAIHPNPPKREMDMLISVGERISMALLAMALSKRNIHALSFTGSQSGIITSPEHSTARIVDVRPKRIQKALCEGSIAIVAGFQGVSTTGEITTLGRGGSDSTAVALGVALDASHIEFYKDVPGLFSEDPKLSDTATFLPQATYDEVAQILQSGGRILHARAVQMAKKNKIPLQIRSFNSKEGEKNTTIFDSSLPQPEQKQYE